MKPFESKVGSTLLEVNEYLSLIPSWVTTRAELDFAELRSIVAFRNQNLWIRLSTAQLLDDLVARQLHAAMFRDVWLWAGEYRNKDLNLGIPFGAISIEMRNLVEDSKLWFGAPSEIELIDDACRFHHRLVAIHPFINGNGRFAREYTNLVLRSLGLPAFTWGRSFENPTTAKRRYLESLGAADGGDLEKLKEFAYT